MHNKSLIIPLFLMGVVISGFWFIGSALTGMLLLNLMAFISYTVLKRNQWHAYGLSHVMLLYLAWLFIVAFTSLIPNTSMMMIGVLAGLPVMYLAGTNIPNFDEVWKILRITIFIFAVMLSSWAIWQVKNNIGYGHAVGPLLDRNAFAALINLLWFLSVYFFISSFKNNNRWKLIVSGVGLLIISVALFATTSRGGIGTWLLLTPLLLIAGFKYTKSFKLILTIILITMLAYVTSSTFLKSSISNRNFDIALSKETGQLSGDASVTARLLIWQSTLKIVRDHPLTGTGWGTFVSFYPKYRSSQENSTSGVSAHNDYLQLTAEGGIPTLLIFFSVLLGILILLKKNLRYLAEEKGIESTVLLIGVLAIFIQAAVNFIFVFAFMNLIAGLYLARVSQLMETAKITNLNWLINIKASVKSVLIGLVILIIGAPFFWHLLAQIFLTGSQPGLKIANLIIPNLNTYQVANFITSFYPKEYIAQQAMIQISEKYLASNINNYNVPEDFKRQILNEMIIRLDDARKRSANNPTLGYREVKLLLEYRYLLGNDVAFNKVSDILRTNLEADPYHAKSMIAMSRLQVLEGNFSEGLKTLNFAENHIRTRRDQQLIHIEKLRLRLLPEKNPNLEALEDQLNMVRSDSETGKPHILPPNFYEGIDKQLNKIATDINANTKIN